MLRFSLLATLSMVLSLWFFWLLYEFSARLKYTEVPTEEKSYKETKELNAMNWIAYFYNIRTSISPSNAAASSRVTLNGLVFRRLEPFWGDLSALFGDIFSDILSVSLGSSKCLEFWSLKRKEKVKPYIFQKLSTYISWNVQSKHASIYYNVCKRMDCMLVLLGSCCNGV